MSQSRLNEVLNNWQQWCDCQPELLRPLVEGLSNQSYLLQLGQQRVVLRLNNPASEALGIDRHAEQQLLTQTHPLKLSPATIHCDIDKQFLISEYIEGQPWQTAYFEQEEYIEQLTDALHRVHQLPAIATRLDIRQRIAHYWKNIDNDELFSQLQVFTPQLETVIQRVEENTTWVPCHNDLLLANLIKNQQSLTILDWEYAAMGDPCFELAVIIEGNQLSKKAITLLLNSYFGEVSSALIQRIDDQRLIYCYLSLLWYAVRQNQPQLYTHSLETFLRKLSYEK